MTNSKIQFITTYQGFITEVKTNGKIRSIKTIQGFITDVMTNAKSEVYKILRYDKHLINKNEEIYSRMYEKYFT